MTLGLTKTYRLTYEATEVMHALFDRTSASQGWRISARVMRDYVEFFGPNTEQLNIVAMDGKAVFTSFTEKVQDGKGTHHVRYLNRTQAYNLSRRPKATSRDSYLDLRRRLRELPHAREYACCYQCPGFQGYRHSC